MNDCNLRFLVYKSTVWGLSSPNYDARTNPKSDIWKTYTLSPFISTE